MAHKWEENQTTGNEIALPEFNGVVFDIHDHNGERWVTAKRVAEALEYESTKELRRLINRNKPEFANKISRVKLTPLELQPNMVLNYDGVILVAMLSKTAKAQDFRRWVINVLKKVMMKGYYMPPGKEQELRESLAAGKTAIEIAQEAQVVALEARRLAIETQALVKTQDETITVIAQGQAGLIQSNATIAEGHKTLTDLAVALRAELTKRDDEIKMIDPTVEITAEDLAVRMRLARRGKNFAMGGGYANYVARIVKNVTGHWCVRDVPVPGKELKKVRNVYPLHDEKVMREAKKTIRHWFKVLHPQKNATGAKDGTLFEKQPTPGDIPAAEKTEGKRRTRRTKKRSGDNRRDRRKR